MIEIRGKYNKAICFTDVIEPSAFSQILSVCNEQAFSDSKIRIMPDVHAGKGCTIGTTMTVIDKVVPNMVGVDIGCGMYTINVGKSDIDLEKFDSVAHYIPSGRRVWERKREKFDIKKLRCYEKLQDIKRLENSLGTLGGGNHFIEIDIDEKQNKYIVIHSGSRNLGSQVAEYYQNIAIKNKHFSLPKDLCYLYGQLMEDYLFDLDICQQFAKRNREIIADILIKENELSVLETFETVHNYININEMILRKGSVSAKKDEKILIPINMRDGSLICIGKGNSDWNCSAPHGAGRLLTRLEAREQLSIDEYEQQMSGIYTTCVNQRTLDESPMAYKRKDDIVRNIEPTAKIITQIKPIYNFKSCE